MITYDLQELFKFFVTNISFLKTYSVDTIYALGFSLHIYFQ